MIWLKPVLLLRYRFFSSVIPSYCNLKSVPLENENDLPQISSYFLCFLFSFSLVLSTMSTYKVKEQIYKSELFTGLPRTKVIYRFFSLDRQPSPLKGSAEENSMALDEYAPRSRRALLEEEEKIDEESEAARLHISSARQVKMAVKGVTAFH